MRFVKPLGKAAKFTAVTMYDKVQAHWRDELAVNRAQLRAQVKKTKAMATP